MYNKELSFTVIFTDSTHQRFSTLSDVNCPISATDYLVKKLKSWIQENYPDKQIKSITLTIKVT